FRTRRRKLPFTETLAAPRGYATTHHIGLCPIRRCRGCGGAVSEREPAEPGNSKKIQHFRCFRCKITRQPPPWTTLLHCKNTVWGSRCAARKTTRWFAARANTPTISP